MLRIIYMLALLLVIAAPAMAQSGAGGLVIDITSPGQTQATLALPAPLGQDSTTPPPLARQLTDAIQQNLGFMPFVRAVDGDDILGGNVVAGPTRDMIDFKRFSLAEADMVVTQYWDEPDGPAGKPRVGLRTYETFGQRLLFGLEFPDVEPGTVQLVADAFCARLMKTLTGATGFFDSKLAFVRQTGEQKEIWVAGPTGRGARRVTRTGGINLSPTWSPDGKTIAFTTLSKKGHLLGLTQPGTGSIKLLDMPGFTVIGPAYTPDGEMAVTLDAGGSPNIYRLDGKLRRREALAKSWSIDVSPSFDASGRQMVFSSGRMGNPHIFLLDVPSGQTRRLTYDGKYNTCPSISPDGRMVVFARDTPDGHRIFLHDLANGSERQISFGPGSDEEPDFGPDGYYVVFSSSRSGDYRLYLTTRHGDAPVALPTGPGNARSPAWTRKTP